MLLPSKQHWWVVAGVYAVAMAMNIALTYLTETSYWPAVIAGSIGHATGALIGATLLGLLLRVIGPRAAVVGMALGWTGYFYNVLANYGVIG